MAGCWTAFFPGSSSRVSFWVVCCPHTHWTQTCVVRRVQTWICSLETDIQNIVSTLYKIHCLSLVSFLNTKFFHSIHLKTKVLPISHQDRKTSYHGVLTAWDIWHLLFFYVKYSDNWAVQIRFESLLARMMSLSTPQVAWVAADMTRSFGLGLPRTDSQLFANKTKQKKIELTSVFR